MLQSWKSSMQILYIIFFFQTNTKNKVTYTKPAKGIVIQYNVFVAPYTQQWNHSCWRLSFLYPKPWAAVTEAIHHHTMGCILTSVSNTTILSLVMKCWARTIQESPKVCRQWVDSCVISSSVLVCWPTAHNSRQSQYLKKFRDSFTFYDVLQAHLYHGSCKRTIFRDIWRIKRSSTLGVFKYTRQKKKKKKKKKRRVWTFIKVCIIFKGKNSVWSFYFIIFHEKTTINAFVIFGRASGKYRTLNRLSMIPDNETPKTPTSVNSFKIKTRTFVLLENIIKLGFRTITSETCESEFVTSWTQNSKWKVTG